MGKATKVKFGTYIQSVHANKSQLKIWEKMERGRIQRLPIFWVPPIISGMDKAMNLKFGRCFHRVHPNKSPLKFWEKMKRGRIRGLPKFFEYPLLYEERVKLRTSNFVRTFLVSIGTTVHYKFLEKLPGAYIVRTLKTSQGTHMLGASRGLLCDSSAVLYILFLFCHFM